MPARKPGYISCINRNSNATFSGTPAWIPIIRARDIKHSRMPGGTPDTSDRSVNLYTTLPVRKKLELSFEAGWDKGAGLTALRTAFLAGGLNNQTTSKIDLSALDVQPTGSGTGYRGVWCVPKFNLDFPLVGDQKVSVSIKPYANYAAGEAVAAYTDATAILGTPETPGTRRPGHVASINNSDNDPITGIRDWKMNLEWAEIDAGDRGSEFEMILMAQLKISIEASFLWDSADTDGVVLFKTAFDDGSALSLTCLDGAYLSVGSWGVTGGFAVTDFSKDDPLTDGQKITVKLEPHANGTAPSFVTIA
jgi:hypothetical protein